MAKLKVEEMIMEITRWCNLDCGHCFRGDAENAFMSFETINNLLGNVDEISKLVISGGEPLIAVAQLNAVADAISRMGIKVDQISIVTNGTILNSDVVRALEKLEMVCKSFNVRVSDDKFHRMALERNNLTNKRMVYFHLLKNLFGATLYGTPRKEKKLSLIEAVGRAKKLTQSDMDEVNAYGEYPTLYALTTSNIFFGADLTVQYEIPVYAGNMWIKNLINIDVNGYLTDSYASYEDADSHNISECNINNVGLLEAVRNNSERVYMVKQKKLK